MLIPEENPSGISRGFFLKYFMKKTGMNMRKKRTKPTYKIVLRYGVRYDVRYVNGIETARIALADFEKYANITG